MASKKETWETRHLLWRIMLLITVLLLFPLTGAVDAAQETVKEKIRYLKSLSLEDLASLEVTSVSKKAEKLSDAAAAVFVITGEDIRRSGVTNIPDALRMVPGIQVARIDANKWAVTARGFNGSFANKLLVLIDGRSVYSPLWSGVFWNVQDTMLEDIEQIEVIRGPGASIWGANAVNGIINIITKRAKDTLGGLISGGVGSEERGFGNVRYGFKSSQESHMRLYAKYFDRDDGVEADGSDGNDQWSALRGGFRLDWEPTETDTLTFQGDAYSGNADVTYAFASLNPPTYVDTVLDESDLDGGNILTRWERTVSKTSGLTLQLYYDHTRTKDALIDEVRNTFDVDFHHRVEWNARHEVIWGLGYRVTQDETEPTQNTMFNPADRTLYLYSAFVQDQITLVPDRFWLTLGSKFEYNTYTDIELQPTGRFLWKPKEDHAVWGAVSRAVRTPSRAERDVQFDLRTLPPFSPVNPGPLPILVRVNGNNQFDSEELIAYELGYRFSWSDRMTWDVAAFYNEYDDVNSSTTGAPILGPGFVILPETLNNGAGVNSWGIEFANNLMPNDWWRVELAYTYLKLDQESGSTDIEDSSPQNQLSIRSAMDMPRNFELDLWLRYVDRLPELNVDDYITFDARVGWKPSANLELALVGQNLVNDQQLEFVNLFLPATSTEIERSVYAKITYSF